MFKEFKEFALKGNVIDLAVGIIIGGAFNNIVSSLVKDIIMPIVSVFLGVVNFTDLSVSIPSISGEKSSILTYGSFIQSVVNFVIISFSVFIMVKFINKLKRLKSTQEEEIMEEKLSREQQLLTEIRDLPKTKNKD